MLKIQKAIKKDLNEIAKICFSCFHGFSNLKEARKWIVCNFNASPRAIYFVIKFKNKNVGYILWLFKGGWRKKSVLELEQIAIEPKYQGCGLGSKLIKESLNQFRQILKKEKRKLKAILVTTGTKQKARRIYEKVLKTRPTAKIKGLFRGDEIILTRIFK